MSKCSICGKEIDEKTAFKLTMNERTRYFCNESCLSDFPPTRTLSRRILSSVVLNKTSAEIIAIGTGIGGIVYTLQGIANGALLMDTVSAIAAIAALIVGIEHLRYLKEHNLLRRAVLFIGIGILICIAILVWHFGFRLNHI
jgi:hypothetical protein